MEVGNEGAEQGDKCCFSCAKLLSKYPVGLTLLQAPKLKSQ